MGSTHIGGAGSGEPFPDSPAPLMDAMELVELVMTDYEETKVDKAGVSMQNWMCVQCPELKTGVNKTPRIDTNSGVV